MLARTLPGTADESEVEVTIEQKGGAPHLSLVPSSRAAPHRRMSAPLFRSLLLFGVTLLLQLVLKGKLIVIHQAL
jgi:hypothetical protein